MLDGSIQPIVRYQDPVAASHWLCRAFGFHVHHEARGAEGNVSHVVLRHGDNFVLIGPPRGTVFDNLMVQPIDVGDRSTQALYVTVGDVDAHCAEARKAGARVASEPCNDDGGRFYMCRDREGHLWSFGNTSHGAKLATTTRPSSADLEKHTAAGSRAIIGLAVLVGLGVGSSATLYLGSEPRPQAMASWIGVASRPDPERGSSAPVSLERDRRVDAERLAAFANERLASAEAAKVELKDKLDASQLHLAEVLRQKEAADQALYISEMVHAEHMKDNRKGLEEAVRAKDQVAQALRLDQQRSSDLQKTYDSAPQQLAKARGDGAVSAQDTEKASRDLEQLKRDNLRTQRAIEETTAQLATVQSAETRLREKLEAAEQHLGDVRSRAAELEAQLKASKLGAEKAAQTAKIALAAAHANEGVLHEKLKAVETEVAKLQSSRSSKAQRTLPAETARRSQSSASERGQLSRATPERPIPTAIMEYRAIREIQEKYKGP